MPDDGKGRPLKRFCSDICRIFHHKERRRAFVAELKKAGCSRCSERHPACLDFHHKDPATKIAGICQMLRSGVSLELIEAEITKCELLCANCHRKEEWSKQ